MKYALYIITLTIILAGANTSRACDEPPTPKTVPDASSVYSLAALATGGLALARRVVR